MRVGILTYWTSTDNYGQILQCFALENFLRQQGHEAFLIRYSPVFQKDNIVVRIKRNLSLKKILSRLSGQSGQGHKADRHERELFEKNAMLNKERKFDEFREKHIIASEECFHSLKELKKHPPVAEAYICGSDQVWNNSLLKSETGAWFLNFGDKYTKRISYAASIGRNLKDEELKAFRKYLRKFDAISVREKSSELLCKRVGISNAVVTLDPTLLLPANVYRGLEQKPKEDVSKPYLFMYVLNVEDKEEIYWNKIKDYQAESGLDIKTVCSSGYVQARELIDGHSNLQATVPEWLYYIDNSKCVITTSFHGVVFCIKMHKPFLAILLTNRFSKGNDRIVSLLNSVGLPDRVLDPKNPIKKQAEAYIDWTIVDDKICELQRKSFDFLNANLK